MGIGDGRCSLRPIVVAAAAAVLEEEQEHGEAECRTPTASTMCPPTPKKPKRRMLADPKAEEEEEEEVEYDCRTPTAARYRLAAEPNTCPPAPKKQRHQRLAATRIANAHFFNPPNLDLLFVLHKPVIH